MILYKLNNFNTIQWWEIELSGLDVTINWGSRLPVRLTDCNDIITLSSPEKAEQEYKSRIAHQIERKGYTETIPTSVPDLPMLAQIYNPKFQFDEFAVQPKLDGIRCIATKNDMISRRNSQITSSPSIALLLNYLPEEIKLDGELYIPNTPFNTIQSYIMRQTPDPGISKIVEYHIFDVIDIEAPFTERYNAALHMLSILEETYFRIRTTPHHPLQSHPWFSQHFPFKIVPTNFFNCSSSSPEGQKIIKSEFDAWKGLGYEGAMIRDSSSPYEPNKRSRNLLKYKSYHESEFKIVDIIPGHNDQAVFVCKTGTSTTNINPKFSHARRRQILKYKHHYIGMWLKVEHEGQNETGKLRCPVGTDIIDEPTK